MKRMPYCLGIWRSLGLLLQAVLLVGCLESNPQPSPAAEDARGWSGDDTAAPAGLDALGGDCAARGDTEGPGGDTTALDMGADGCVPDCAGKECGDDGCGGSCGECDPSQECMPWEQICAWVDYPDCNQKECGDDGMGGSCGFCEEGLECLTTWDGWLRCTHACEVQGDCEEGTFCLFGLCATEECTKDEDCGDPQEFYCDKYLRCRKYVSCADTADCNFWNKHSWCDEDVGVCRFDGDCWEDDDCVIGACGADHWCEVQLCGGDGPGCAPHVPVCDYSVGETDPLCVETPECLPCVAPCVFDTECPVGQVCEYSVCLVWDYNNDCILDSDCPEGWYCHPGCVPLPTACALDSDCAPGHGCIAGHCSVDVYEPCVSDEECSTMYEGYACVDGLCRPVDFCWTDDQCAPGEYCQGGLTCGPVPELPECKSDAGCDAGLACDILNGHCVVPPECAWDVQCPDGFVCEDQVCQNDQGLCAWIEKGPGFCDDGDPCTVDGCDAASGCTHVDGACAP